jgi:hypothetical protein
VCVHVCVCVVCVWDRDGGGGRKREGGSERKTRRGPFQPKKPMLSSEAEKLTLIDTTQKTNAASSNRPCIVTQE